MYNSNEYFEAKDGYWIPTSTTLKEHEKASNWWLPDSEFNNPNYLSANDARRVWFTNDGAAIAYSKIGDKQFKALMTGLRVNVATTWIERILPNLVKEERRRRRR